VADAFFNGLGTIPGRLALNGGLSFRDTTTIGTIEVDNNGLWQFITPGLSSGVSDVPESCEEHNFVPGDTELPAAYQDFFNANATSSADRLRILLQRCITHYNGSSFNFIPGLNEQGSCGPADNQPCTGLVFGRDTNPLEEPNAFDIQYTPRFGYVPEVHSSTPIGTSPLAWASFQPVFIQRIYGGHDGQAWSFEPEPDSSATYAAESDAAGVTVFVLPRTALPGDLGDEDAPFNIGENIAIRLMR
jgi:hypothetical protein